MTDRPLFPLPAREPDGESCPWPRGVPRLRRPVRNQLEWCAATLDQRLPEDHEARTVWAFVEGMDMTPLLAEVEAVEGGVGRPPADPRVLTALWLFATIEGVGSARELARLCQEHDAYRWLCGGVTMNYHTLSDFRVGHMEVLDHWLTHGVATLMAQGLVDLNRVAQDGMRVRASAGAASFRRRETLEECLKQAKQQVERLRRETEEHPGAATARQQAARERAARERTERILAALKQMPDVEAKKKPDEKTKARVSTTDADARVMKMPDGGFRPAVNVQFATDTATQVIVGVDVTNSGSDQGQMSPMVEQQRERYQRVPGDYLVDGGFTAKDEIDKVSVPSGPCVVYAPVMKPKNKSRDPHVALPGDSPAVAAWRERMGTEEAKTVYKERAATAECVNAQSRQQGLYQITVRGVAKAKAVGFWHALAHNLRRAVALVAAATAPAAVSVAP